MHIIIDFARIRNLIECMQSGKLKSCGCMKEMKDNIFLFSQKFALIFLSFPMM